MWLQSNLPDCQIERQSLIRENVPADVRRRIFFRTQIRLVTQAAPAFHLLLESALF